MIETLIYFGEVALIYLIIVFVTYRIYRDVLKPDMNPVDRVLHKLRIKNHPYSKQEISKLLEIARGKQDPLYKYGETEFHKILDKLREAALEGNTKVILPIHPSDKILEDLEFLGYKVELDTEVKIAPESPGAIRHLDGYWYVLGITIRIT